MFGALCEGLRATPKFDCSKPELGISFHGPGSPPCTKLQVALLNLFGALCKGLRATPMFGALREGLRATPMFGALC